MPCLQEEVTYTVACILQHYVAELDVIKKVLYFFAVNFKYFKIRTNTLLCIICIYSFYFNNWLSVLNQQDFFFSITEKSPEYIGKYDRYIAFPSKCIITQIQILKQNLCFYYFNYICTDKCTSEHTFYFAMSPLKLILVYLCVLSDAMIV